MIAPPLALDPAAEQDLPLLLEIEEQSYSNPWTPRNFLDVLGGGTSARVLVLRTPDTTGSRVAAYCCYALAADELHVHNLTVAPGLRRRGLGRRLLALILDMAARRGARLAVLEVRETNRAARALYARLGFGEIGRRRAYYSRPLEDALVLGRRLP